MVFLVLLNYSLPNGTVQTSDSGFIVREKNIPTAALTDLRTHRNQVFDFMLISLKYANGLRIGANSDTHRCKQLTEHGEERCIKLREVAGFSAVRTIFQIVGPRKILHCLLGK